MAAPQSPSVLNVDAALLRIDTLMAITGLGRTTIYSRLGKVSGREGDPMFPKPFYVGPTKRLRWRAADVRRWLEQQAAEVSRG